MTTPRSQHANPLIEYDPSHLDENYKPIFTQREIEILQDKNITYNKDHPVWADFNRKNKYFRDNYFTSGPNWNNAAAVNAQLAKDEAFDAAIAKTQTSGGYKKRRRGKVTRHRRSKRRNSRNSRRVRRN